MRNLILTLTDPATDETRRIVIASARPIEAVWEDVEVNVADGEAFAICNACGRLCDEDVRYSEDLDNEWRDMCEECQAHVEGMRRNPGDYDPANEFDPLHHR